MCLCSFILHLYFSNFCCLSGEFPDIFANKPFLEEAFWDGRDSPPFSLQFCSFSPTQHTVYSFISHFLSL